MLSEGSDLALPWHPYASFGFLMGPRSAAVAVDPAASQALRPGDTIDLRRMPPEDRFILGRVVSPGRVLHLPLTSGRNVTLTAQTLARSVTDNVSNFIEVLAMLAYMMLAATLVLIRPTPSTWAFYVFSYPFCVFAATPNMLPFAIAFPGAVLLTVASAVSPGAFVSFALRFPEARPRSWEKRLEQVVLFIATPLLVAFGTLELFAFVFIGWTPAPWLNTVVDVLRVSGYAIGVVALIARYISAPTDERNRLRWVVWAFAIAFLPFLTLTFVWNQSMFPAGPTTINLCQAWTILAPIALAYTVLKHRLFDIRLVVSRALMYTAMTSLIVGAVALIDWAFSKWLEQSRFATVVELALTLFLGAMLMMLHRRLELVLNRVIFRSQTLALEALRRFAQETDLIADPARLLSQTYEALRSRLESEYVAIYSVDGASYALSTPQERALPTILAADDFAVLRVRRWSEPFECDEPAHLLRGALLIPMTARTQLVGFIVCGPKRDRTHYLPGEIDTLTMLSHRVASSYAWLTLASNAPLLSSPSFEPPV